MDSSPTYRPLPKYLTIQPSKIEGLGLFTIRAIRDLETSIGVTHVFMDDKGQVIRTPLGGFINHSSEPNCFIHTNIHYHNGQQRELYTVRPVEEGEELTVYYTVGYDDIL